MANISEEKWIEMLEKKADGSYIAKYPKVKSKSGVTFEGHLADGTQHAKTARFVIGTSTSGWTEKDCDYLCGGTADQTEINAAITALPATGGEIVILDGTYNITAKIDVTKDNVSIRGNGNATILKRMFNSSVEEGVITLSFRSGCKIANLQIEGNKASYTNSNNYGICLVYSSNDNTVTGNTCSNNTGAGIYLDTSSNNNTVTGNICNNNENGICLVYSSNDNTVTGNTCSNNTGAGIYLDTSSNDNTVTGNTCNNNNYGIDLTTSSNNTVTGNTYNNNNTVGIYLTTSSNNNNITSNACMNNNRGIFLTSSSNNTVTGNTCNNNNSYGIYAYNSSDNTITSNTCNNNSTGISSTSSSDNNITSNTCNNNNYGIYVYSTSNNNAVTGNTCNNNSYGIYLTTSSNNTVTGNTCIRGTGTPEDYTIDQYTILLSGNDNDYNLISSNNCMGKAVVVGGGTGNSAWGNKFDNTDDLP